MTEVWAAAQALFGQLDDLTKLGAHIGRRSMIVMGRRMTYDSDEAKGSAVRSVIRMGGRFLGLIAR